MKICPKCELNFINDTDEFCEICSKQINIKNNGSVDNNKLNVEKNLLPILRSLPQKTIETLTTKEGSFNLFKIRLPLLLKCKNLGKECCKNEIRTGNSDVYRYYMVPYEIHGNKYHICSQWWGSNGEQSKDILKICKYLKNNF